MTLSSSSFSSSSSIIDPIQTHERLTKLVERFDSYRIREGLAAKDEGEDEDE